MLLVVLVGSLKTMCCWFFSPPFPARLLLSPQAPMITCVRVSSLSFGERSRLEPRCCS